MANPQTPPISSSEPGAPLGVEDGQHTPGPLARAAGGSSGPLFPPPAESIPGESITPAMLQRPLWEIAENQEKVETAAGTFGFEAAKVTAGEARTRGVWKTTAEIPAKTQFMTLKAPLRPVSVREGQLALVCGLAEKLTVVFFNVLTNGKIEPQTTIPVGAFINFNGGWWNAIS